MAWKAETTERVRVDSKGRISIPTRLRKHLGLDQGMELEISEDGGGIVLAPLIQNPVGAIFDVLGRAIPEGKTAMEVQHELRPEWDRDISGESSRRHVDTYSSDPQIYVSKPKFTIRFILNYP